jgi:hypothetical protein
MPFIDTAALNAIERLPGWQGRYFTRGASIHEHFHSEEEVHEVIEGKLELTIDGRAIIVDSPRRRPGF